MPYSETAWTKPEYGFPVETYLDWLDASGVRFGVIAAASLFGTNSDYTVQALKAHSRLRGTVIVGPESAFSELKAMRDAGAVGVRFQWFFRDPLPDLHADPYRTLMKRLRDLDMHVHINIEGRRLPEVLGQAVASGVKTLVDHFGWSTPHLDPDGAGHAAMVETAAAGKCWIKLSSGFRYPNPETPRDLARMLVERVGTERLFWGSDAPFVGMENKVSYPDTVALYQSWLPDPHVRRAIDETAYRFYFS